MHATSLINTHLRRLCQGVHKKRVTALLAITMACVHGKKLSVTGLGRSLRTATDEKHNIKRADRLIGNVGVHHDRRQLYRAMAKLIIGKQMRPVVLVDWSDLSADGYFQVLRASLPVGGRALTLYEEVHPENRKGSTKIESRFLKTLKEILPEGSRPILVTDAGFHTPWFKAVRRLGWDFVGRIGGHIMITPHLENKWVRVERVFATATTRARYIGCREVAKSNPMMCHAYLLKKKKVGREKKTVFGTKSKAQQSNKHAKRERTPWLIITSLEGGASITKTVMSLYRTRMQIEEAFRDVKNARWGFSLDEAKSYSTARYENLLFIGALATFAVYLVGQAATMKNIQRQFQANTVVTRNVLSTFFLGCRVLLKRPNMFCREDIKRALHALSERFAEHCYV